MIGCGKIFRINNELCSPANLCPDCQNEQARIGITSEDHISKDMRAQALKSTSNKRDGSSDSQAKDVKVDLPNKQIDSIFSSQPDAFLGGYATYHEVHSPETSSEGVGNVSSHTSQVSSSEGDAFSSNKYGEWRAKGKLVDYGDWLNGWAKVELYSVKSYEFTEGYKQAVTDIMNKMGLVWLRYDKRSKTGFAKE